MTRNLPNSTKRKLFSEKENETPNSKVFIISDVTIKASSKHANEVSTGLCYACIMNITVLKSGKKCNFCTRTYHLACIDKSQQSENNEKFVCNSCKAKNSFS